MTDDGMAQLPEQEAGKTAECRHEDKMVQGEGRQTQADGSILLLRSYYCDKCGKSWIEPVPGGRLWKDHK